MWLLIYGQSCTEQGSKSAKIGTLWPCVITSEGYSWGHSEFESVAWVHFSVIMELWVGENGVLAEICMHWNAFPRVSRHAMQCLNHHFPGHWIGHRGLQRWPLQSPALNLFDFHEWEYVKDLVYEHNMGTAYYLFVTLLIQPHMSVTETHFSILLVLSWNGQECMSKLKIDIFEICYSNESANYGKSCTTIKCHFLLQQTCLSSSDLNFTYS